ncbi:diguanylate cyclase [Tissierella praeacuta]|uniref:diguanylate cyclase n=1 Tax=Tissierella praeacuta TaxID=43131 RepID=UPI003342C1B3
MCKGNFETNKLIQIIINQEHRIQYSNIGNQRAYDYLKELHILENLSTDLPINYTSINYFISVDKFYIYNQIHYIIMMTPKFSKCNNCSNLLIDSVTGLYNRNYWEKINSKIRHNIRFKDFSLILIDIDNLKKINDIYGHLEGDKAIKVVGQAIQHSIRKEDIGIRYGGDEFIILLLNQDRNTVEEIIKRIRRGIYKQVIEENIDVQISTGVAFNDCYYNMEDIMRIADKNLYKEKEIKKGIRHEKTNTLKELSEQIEGLRSELNKQIIEKDKVKILELSQKLDILIVEYLKNS